MKAARAGGKLQIDYLGISLIAMGFGALEIVLDKGQREDWLESHFIVIFLTVAIAALIAAVAYEWNATMIRWWRSSFSANATSRMANALYFGFFFILFGSTVLIPQVLQSLYGYTATDAGLVLGPGAFVIVLMAPIVVRLIPKIGRKKTADTRLDFYGAGDVAIWFTGPWL